MKPEELCFGQSLLCDALSVFEACETCLSSTVLANPSAIGSDEVVLPFNVDSVDPDVTASWTRSVEREEELYLVDVCPTRPGTRDKVIPIGSNVDFEPVPVASADSVDIRETRASKDCIRAAGYELNLRIEDSLVTLDIEDDPRGSDLPAKLGEVESEIGSRGIVQRYGRGCRAHARPVRLDAVGINFEVASTIVIGDRARSSDAVAAEAPGACVVLSPEVSVSRLDHRGDEVHLVF